MPKLRTITSFENLSRLEAELTDAPYKLDLTYVPGDTPGEVTIIVEPGYAHTADLKERVERAGFRAVVEVRRRQVRLTVLGGGRVH